MHLHCCYGLCKSDSRKPEAGVTFIPFPKPRRKFDIARRWVHLCGRKNFTVESITRCTYICSKHFPVGALLNIKANPTLEPFDARKPPPTPRPPPNPRSPQTPRMPPTPEPFEARKPFKKEAKEQLEVQKIEDPLSVRIQFKQEPKGPEEEQTNVNPFSMIKSLISRKETNENHKDPAYSNTDRRSNGHGFANSYNCEECDYTSTYKSYFNQHLREVHNRIELFECEHCEYETYMKLD